MASRELRYREEIIPVENKALDFLIYLVQHSHRTVSKEELHKVLWKNRPLSDTVMARCVMKVRKAVADDGQRQDIIKTIPGFGYQFVADVTTDNCSWQTDGELADQSGQPVEKPTQMTGIASLIINGWELIAHNGSVRNRIYLLSAFLLLSVSISLTLYFDGADHHSTIRCSVLPVHNATNDDALNWISHGLITIIEQSLALHAPIQTVSYHDIFDNMTSLLNPSEPLNGNMSMAIPDAESARGSYIIASSLQRDNGLLRLQYTVHKDQQEYLKGNIIAEHPVTLARILGDRIGTALTMNVELLVPLSTVSPDPVVQDYYQDGLKAYSEGSYHTALQLFNAGLDLSTGAHWLQLEVARSEFKLGNWDSSKNILEGLVAKAEITRNSILRIASHDLLGNIEYYLNNLATAEHHLQRGLALANNAAGRRFTPLLLTHLARVKHQQGALPEAEKLLMRALKQDEVQDKRAVAETHLELGRLYFRQGKLNQAKSHSMQALESGFAMNLLDLELQGLNAMGTIHLSLGNPEAAEAYFNQALSACRNSDDRQQEIYTLHNLAQLKLRQSQLSYSLQLIQDAIHLTVDSPVAPSILPSILIQRAHLYAKEGNYQRARSELEQIYRSLDHLNDRSQSSIALLKLGRVELMLKDYGKAEQHANMLLEIANNNNDNYLKANTLRLKGNIEHAYERFEKATALYWEALVLAEGLEFPKLIAEVKLDIGFLSLERENLDFTITLLNKLKTDNTIFHWKFLEARLNYQTGNFAEAVKIQLEAKKLAGETWLETDEAILGMYQAAATTNKNIPIDITYTPYFI